MIEIKGKYNMAKVFTDNVENEAVMQITELCNQEFVKESIIRIMPDTHAGAGCTIGTTMTITDKIVPNLVGVDIGCGMETIKLRDGSLVCIGKGNRDWNYSAPHGAGRLMSRSKAKAVLSLEDFKKSMKGIYSTTINSSTLDECAFAYKPMEEIMENIKETVEIVDIIKPVYNFKASD
jgi:RNA-splicing ligase RtcB